MIHQDRCFVWAAAAVTVVLVALQATSASGAVFQVTTQVDVRDDTPGDGVCSSLVVVGPPVGIPPFPQLGFRCTLRGAVEEANARPGQDEILLPAGHFEVATSRPDDENDAGVGDLDLIGDLEIRGAGRASSTIYLDGFGIDAGFHAGAGSVLELRSLSLEGFAQDRVNAVYTEAGSILVDDVDAFRLRSVASGPYADPLGTLTVTDSTTSAIQEIAAGLAAVSLDRVQWSGRIDAGHVEVRDSSAVDGWIFFAEEGGTLDIDGSDFRGLGVTGADEVRSVNSTFSANGSGTALGIQANTVHLTFSTIYSWDTASGAALRIDADHKIFFDHSIVAATNVPGPQCKFLGTALVVSNHSIDGDGSCRLFDPTDLPNTDAMLEPLADNGGPTFTHALATGSPARDAGTSFCSVATDQRGVQRPKGSACDIGAYEAPGSPRPPSCGLGAELALLLPLLRVWSQRGSGARPGCGCAEAAPPRFGETDPDRRTP